MSTPQNPLMGGGQDPTQGMMQQAQQTMNNPMAQGVPQPSPMAGIANHPVVQALVQSIAKAMQTAGFVGATPQVRQQGQEMENQKAETMARMAQTGAFQQGELGIRQQLASTAQQKADTGTQAEARKMSMDEFTKAYKQQTENDKVTHNQALEALGQGRIDEASRRNDTYLESVKNRYQVAEQTVGLGYGKLAVQQDLTNIMRYRSALEGIATSQRGTEMGMKAQLELSKQETDNTLKSMLGLGGFPRAEGAIQQSLPMPGAAAPTGSAPTAAPALGGPPPAPAQAAPTNKIQAKRQQQNKPSGGGATHMWTPNGIQPIGGTQP